MLQKNLYEPLANLIQGILYNFNIEARISNQGS